MKTFNASATRAGRRVLSSACASVLAVASMMSLSPLAHGAVVAPDVPPEIRVDEGFTPFLEGHAIGTQNYACSPSGSGFAWILFTPEATLFSDAEKQVITHFFSPNPEEPNPDSRVVADGAIRAAWQHSRDSSTVWAALAAPQITVREDSITWLKLAVVGRQEGPTGGDTLTQAQFVQRVNTVGGLAPKTGCSQASDVGKKAFIPYTADYFFWAPTEDVQ